MCGIVGFMRWNGGGKHLSQATLLRARDRMVMRGPDQHGIWMAPDVACGLGHRRLAVLDLNPRAAQPMVDPVNGNVLVFNGEIYNFRALRCDLESVGCSFQTTSDSEVLLASYRVWGPECVHRFVGMFAFSIWQPLSGEMFLARDRFGVKPLLYYLGQDYLVFSSRLQPLLDLGAPLMMELDAVAEFIEMGWVTGPRTLVSGVRKLEPGHWMQVCEDRGIVKHSYWSPEKLLSDKNLSPSQDDLNVTLRGAVEEAVASRMVSDVPVGCFLSGGIDSTLVTAIAAAHNPDHLKTFTIAFENAKNDESVYAKKIAAYLGCQHHELLLTAHVVRNEIEDLLNEFDEPVADVAALPTILLARYARHEVTVCLTGDGGDELFLGYPIHRVQQRLSLLKYVPYALRARIGAWLSRMHNLRAQLLGGYLNQRDELDAYLYLRSQTGCQIEGDKWQARSNLERFFPCYDKLGSGTASSLIDLMGYLPDALLVKTDLSTMCAGLEAREPLLDHRLAELAFSIPESDRRGKKLLRQLLTGYVPHQMWDRPKHAFDVPIGDWLRGPLAGHLEWLCDNWVAPEVLSKSRLLQLVDNHRHNKKDWGTLLWSMIVLSRWKRRFIGSA